MQIIGLNHIMIKTSINKKKKNGFTLVEIMVALGIFALLAIPAYMMFAHSASTENEYHKNATANRLMESFRDELKQYPFDEAKGFTNATNAPPATAKVYQEAQSKYSDMQMKIEPSEIDDKTMKFVLTVTWKSRSGKERKETSTFVKVK